MVCVHAVSCDVCSQLIGGFYYAVLLTIHCPSPIKFHCMVQLDCDCFWTGSFSYPFWGLT